MRKYCLFILLLFLAAWDTEARKVDLSSVFVPEEGGIKFMKITDDADLVAPPPIRKTGTFFGNAKVNTMEWWVNPMIALNPDGTRIGYINAKNNMRNIMVKNAQKGGASVQRTFRDDVYDFSWSPDGKSLCFTEYRNNQFGIYLVNADQGSVVQQISASNSNDLGGVITPDGVNVFFHRGEGYSSYSLWSFNRKTNLFYNYSRGMTPCLIPGDANTVYCGRFTDKKESEIWKVNFQTGVEEVILSKPGKSFTTPQLSPDGKWILCTGNSITPQGKIANTDIYVVRVDGTQLTQLTYHPGNDLSAIWGKDGKTIFFLSQRGTTGKDVYNVWQMDFSLE